MEGSHFLILNMKFRPVADWAKASGVKQFLFISSAGIYKTSDEIPHVERVCCIIYYKHDQVLLITVVHLIR